MLYRNVGLGLSLKTKTLLWRRQAPYTITHSLTYLLFSCCCSPVLWRQQVRRCHGDHDVNYHQTTNCWCWRPTTSSETRLSRAPPWSPATTTTAAISPHRRRVFPRFRFRFRARAAGWCATFASSGRSAVGRGRRSGPCRRCTLAGTRHTAHLTNHTRLPAVN